MGGPREETERESLFDHSFMHAGILCRPFSASRDNKQFDRDSPEEVRMNEYRDNLKPLLNILVYT